MITYYKISVEQNENVYGDGKRLVIWVKGCSLHCKGCCNQHLWSKDGGKTISAKDLAKLVQAEDIDGITFLGGEPMEQSDELAKVASVIHKMNKSIICFTGYNIEELTLPSQQKLLKYCDILISGRYVQEQRNIHLQFRGSTNQIVHFLSDRYQDYILQDNVNTAILYVDESGEISCQGLPSDSLITMLDNMM